MVHVASYSRSDDGNQPGSAGRRWQDRRSRRSLPRQERDTHAAKPVASRPLYLKGGKHNEKRTIVALIERGGEVRVKHARDRITSANVRDILVRNADSASRLHTDESNQYPSIGTEFAKHETVNHGAKEYAHDDVTTNSVESFFGIFKRGLNGNYQHCGEQHFQRYLNKFDFATKTASSLAWTTPNAR